MEGYLVWYASGGNACSGSCFLQPSSASNAVSWCPFSSARLTLTLTWKLLSATELRKQCRLLVPFLFGEATPNPNLKPTWLAIIAGRARPDEPEVVGGVQEVEGW